MPISQQTMLALYGRLADIADASSRMLKQCTQGDLLTPKQQPVLTPLECLAALDGYIGSMQKHAIEDLLSDDREIEINPITGRVE